MAVSKHSSKGKRHQVRAIAVPSPAGTALIPQGMALPGATERCQASKPGLAQHLPAFLASIIPPLVTQ